MKFLIEKFVNYILADEPLYVDPDALAEEVEEEVDPTSFQPRAMLMDVGRYVDYIVCRVSTSPKPS